MNAFNTMIKINLKLLLRNKGYLCFLILLPVLSVLLLNIPTFANSDKEDNNIIHDINKEDEMVDNYSSIDDKLNIRIFDYSKSELSDYIIKELSKTGSYRIYRYEGAPVGIDKAREKAINAANHNVIGAVIYIPDTFEKKILNKDTDDIVVFKVSKDGRTALLENNLKAYLTSISQYAAETNYNKQALDVLLKTSENNEISKEVISLEVGNKLNLNSKQKSKSFCIGYSLSILTIAFLFGGVFIAGVIADERQNRVYNRIIMSKTSLGKYGAAKLFMVFLTVLIQTGVMAIAIKLFGKSDFGIPYISYIFLVFFLGLIFNLISVVTGVLTNNVISSSYIAFFIWSFSDMFAGLYFPLDSASKWWIRTCTLMPQRWVVKSAEMIMAGKSGVYSMFLFVVLGYLVIILSVGMIGIKIRRKE